MIAFLKKAVKICFHNIYALVNHERFAKYIGVNIGEDVHIYGNPISMFSTEPWLITIGNHVHITKDVLFITHDGGTLLFRHLVNNLEITAPIVIGDYVYIGVRSIILCGVKIGNNCIIAAGSVVTKNIPDNCVVGGVPARIIETTPEYLNKIKQKSLNLGHLKGKEKDIALKHYFKYSSNN